jgi:hypothetical protein
LFYLFSFGIPNYTIDIGFCQYGILHKVLSKKMALFVQFDEAVRLLQRRTAHLIFNGIGQYA